MCSCPERTAVAPRMQPARQTWQKYWKSGAEVGVLLWDCVSVCSRNFLIWRWALKLKSETWSLMELDSFEDPVWFYIQAQCKWIIHGVDARRAIEVSIQAGRCHLYVLWEDGRIAAWTALRLRIVLPWKLINSWMKPEFIYVHNIWIPVVFVRRWSQKMYPANVMVFPKEFRDRMEMWLL